VELKQRFGRNRVGRGVHDGSHRCPESFAGSRLEAGTPAHRAVIVPLVTVVDGAEAGPYL
jgi:hypothetical protein